MWLLWLQAGRTDGQPQDLRIGKLRGRREALPQGTSQAVPFFAMLGECGPSRPRPLRELLYGERVLVGKTWDQRGDDPGQGNTLSFSDLPRLLLCANVPRVLRVPSPKLVDGSPYTMSLRAPQTFLPTRSVGGARAR